MKGYAYFVSDEQIAVYRALTIEQKLRWLDDSKRTAFALATDSAKASWARLRGGG